MSGKERFEIAPFTNSSGEQVWRVHGRMPDGSRVRENHQSFEEAIARKSELEILALNLPTQVGLKRTRLTDQQLAEASSRLTASTPSFIFRQ